MILQVCWEETSRFHLHFAYSPVSRCACHFHSVSLLIFAPWGRRSCYLSIHLCFPAKSTVSSILCHIRSFILFTCLTNRSLLKSVEEELQQRWVTLLPPHWSRVSWYAGLLTKPTHKPIIVNGRTNRSNHTQLTLLLSPGCQGSKLLDSAALYFPSAACFTLWCH